MTYHVEYSTKIYDIYLKYIAPEDIRVYSIDEEFIDLTNYLMVAWYSTHVFARMLIQDARETTGIAVADGISPICTCNAAMDIVAKYFFEDKDGVRMELRI